MYSKWGRRGVKVNNCCKFIMKLPKKARRKVAYVVIKNDIEVVKFGKREKKV